MLELAVLKAQQLDAASRHLCDLATLLGVSGRLISIAPGEVPKDVARAEAVAISATALCSIDPASAWWTDIVGSPRRGVLVYGYRRDEAHTALVRRLTGGRIDDIVTIENGRQTTYPVTSKPFTRQLAGCALDRAPSEQDSAFVLRTPHAIDLLSEVAGNATFVRMPLEDVEWFHWANTGNVHGPETIVEEAEFTRISDRFVPLLIVLRTLFPERCWANPVSTARIIIDDPLLCRQYGFLNYDGLFASINKLKYGVTTAFIPWNHERTSAKAARTFVKHIPQHSLCVHGCDHTNDEFAAPEEALLAVKSRVSLDRMGQHHERTGIPCDPIMVFPQGKFSGAALRVLRRAGFSAVVNSTRIPTDHTSRGLALGEELRPATNAFSGLPVFGRRYPRELSAYALDLFLGRPALVVEHHDWFKGGLSELERTVQFLHEVEPSLSWPPLGEGLGRQHLRRRQPDGTSEIMFFTPSFEFSNPYSEANSFVFCKLEPDPTLLSRVTVNGEDCMAHFDDGLLTFRHTLGPEERIQVEVAVQGFSDPIRWTPGIRYRTNVSLRRALSEFRDNQLEKHPTLLATAKRIVRRWA